MLFTKNHTDIFKKIPVNMEYKNSISALSPWDTFGWPKVFILFYTISTKNLGLRIPYMVLHDFKK